MTSDMTSATGDTPTHFSDPTTIEARRRSFESGAAAYDEVRPAWDEEAVDWMLGRPAGPLDVLDLGAGTGLGTRTVATLGHRVTALDPSADMLAALTASLEHLPGSAGPVSTRQASAESLSDADASLDAVTAFSSWHWFDWERTQPECARVLRPGGILALGWHSWADQVDWLRELGEIVDTSEMIWDPERPVAARLPEIDGFGPAENAQFGQVSHLTPDDLVRLASSWSPVAVREDRDQVLAAVHDLGVRVAGPGSTVRFEYVADCFRYRRTRSCG
jgi:SAM-dependent methyltransferase